VIQYFPEQYFLLKFALRRNPKILNRVGKSFDSKLCIMKRNKFFSATITLLLIAFFATSWVSPVKAQKPKAVLITVPFIFAGGSFPDFVYTGPFTISGAFEATGTAEMDANVTVYADFSIYDCKWTLTNEDGTIKLHEKCHITASSATGIWEIVSGTGDYANLRGNGSALMPAEYLGVSDEAWEILTGVIFTQDRRRHTEDHDRNFKDREHDQ
jgi:hypothetical protein